MEKIKNMITFLYPSVPSNKVEENTNVVATMSLPDEEILFLACDKKERERILEIGTMEKKTVAPSLRIKIDIPENSYYNEFDLSCTIYGFQFTDTITKEVYAHEYLSKNLALHYQEIDIEILRGFAALTFLNLEKYIGLHIDVITMLYSPAFTDYLYHCIEYISNKKIAQL